MHGRRDVAEAQKGLGLGCGEDATEGRTDMKIPRDERLERKHARTHTCTHTHTYIHARSHIREHTCTHTYMFAHTRVYTHTHAHGSRYEHTETEFKEGPDTRSQLLVRKTATN